MLRTRREKVSLISGGPDRPKCDISLCGFDELVGDGVSVCVLCVADWGLGF
jgi:hypothetical protein